VTGAFAANVVNPATLLQLPADSRKQVLEAVEALAARGQELAVAGGHVRPAHSENRPLFLEREPRRVHGPAICAGLNHDHCIRQAGDDPVAGEEGLGEERR
jgi:hypothetical protein